MSPMSEVARDLAPGRRFGKTGHHAARSAVDDHRAGRQPGGGHMADIPEVIRPASRTELAQIGARSGRQQDALRRILEARPARAHLQHVDAGFGEMGIDQRIAAKRRIAGDVLKGVGLPVAGIGGDSGGEKDPMYDQAVAVVLQDRKASISYVQRKLKIGYNRSARLLEDMEKAGLVSSLTSSGQRDILVAARGGNDD